MDRNTTERIMSRAILNFIDDDEGIVVEDIDNTKYIISRADKFLRAIRIEKITGSDDCIVQSLSEGQRVHLDK